MCADASAYFGGGRQSLFYVGSIVFWRERKSSFGSLDERAVFMGGLADEDSSFGNISAVMHGHGLVRAKPPELWA